MRLALVATLTILTATYGIVKGKLPISRSVLADAGRVVSLYADGQTRIIPTTANTVGDLLTRAHIKLQPGDIVEPAAAAAIPTGASYVNVYRSRPVVVVDGGSVSRGNSAYQNPQLILQQLGVTVYPQDQITTAPITNFINSGVIGEQITITRAPTFTVLVDGGSKQVRSRKPTVGEALAENGIQLAPKDKVSPALNSGVVAGETITITRESDVTTTVKETIAHDTQTVSDNTIDIGQQVIRKAGSDGERQATYHIHYVNGQPTSKQLLSATIIKQPVTEVVAVGTKISDNTWYQLRLCESGNNYQDKANADYRGAYQFSFSTWGGYGGYNDPADAPPYLQDAKAHQLQAADGWYPWPSCARSLGLL